MNIEINGYPMEFNLQKLMKCSDLIYFDGPLLSHYIDDSGDNYLLYWLESDEKCNRWMIVRTTMSQIQDYTAKLVSLRDVILNPCDTFVFVTDIDNDLNCQNTKCVPLKSIPDEYLPDKDSFYAFQMENVTVYPTLYNPQLFKVFLRQFLGQNIMSSITCDIPNLSCSFSAPTKKTSAI